MSQNRPLLARQPIFDRNMHVVAYELLYRNSDSNHAEITDADTASSEVLLNTFTESSLQQVVGNKKAFINFTRALMSAPLPFNTEQLVIEVLETEIINAELIDKLSTLQKNGFTIALDDFEITPESKQLIPYAKIIKLDVLALTEQQLEQHIQQLKSYEVEILAEKVETIEMLEKCKALGCDLFQGYFLEKPQIIKGKKLSSNKQAIVQLLAKLHNPEVSIEELQTLISHDPVLSLKLLQLVNSSAFSMPREIESLQLAITLLGLKVIKNWVGLLAMAKLDDKPRALSAKTLGRAKFCELMAAVTRPQHLCDTFFTVGLLSTLDVYMDTPLEKILQDIQISPILCRALLQHAGDEGQFLATACAYENGQWDAIDWTYLQQHKIDENTLATLYFETLTWVDQAQESMFAKP